MGRDAAGELLDSIDLRFSEKLVPDVFEAQPAVARSLLAAMMALPS
jgi:hypothetical protein